MAKGKKSSPSNKAHYQRYKSENKWLKNKIVKLMRVVSNQPENKQAAEALKRCNEGKVKFTKKAPNSPNRKKQTYFEFVSNVYSKVT